MYIFGNNVVCIYMLHSNMYRTGTRTDTTSVINALCRQGRTAELADACVEQVPLGRVLQQVVLHALPRNALIDLYGLAVPLELRRKLRHLRKTNLPFIMYASSRPRHAADLHFM